MSTPTEGTEPVEAAPGYRPGRTLPLRVELVRQLGRRRTAVVFGLLAVLPFVLVAAFAIGGTPMMQATVSELFGGLEIDYVVQADFEGFMPVAAELMPQPQSAITALVVPFLSSPEQLVEIEAIAAG